MREIKFRAFDKEHRIFMEIESLDMNFIYQNKKHIAVWRKPYKFENSNAISHRAKVDKTILMQYTGLKDKNGIEIYEGDIFIKDYTPHIIEFHNGRYVGTTGKGYDTRNCVDLDEDLAYIITTIGNIYENKELLKENNE